MGNFDMSPMPSPSSVSASDTVMASSSPASKNVNVPKAQEHQTQPVLNAATPGCGSVKGKTVSDFGVKVASASETDIADSRKKKPSAVYATRYSRLPGI